jgi:hypothetical protein
MTEAEVREAVLATIRLMIDDPSTALTGDIAPIDVLGLDSEDGLDFAELISERLPIVVPVEVNPFKNDEAQKARTLDEIIALLLALTKQEEP